MLMTQIHAEMDGVATDPTADMVEQIVDLMLSVMSDGLDHPELWAILPDFLAVHPMLVPALQTRRARTADFDAKVSLRLLLGLCGGEIGDPLDMIAVLTPLAIDFSQSPLVQGVLFRLHALADPGNPKYALAGRICETPFEQIDVLEATTHLCCASRLSTSAGDLSTGTRTDAWNSETAQAIRASIHDGSYRYCNKDACPKIQSDVLPRAEALQARSPFWADILAHAGTEVPQGPATVDLACDRTCDLSWPSCRVRRFAADDAMRDRLADLQEREILPLLANAKTVFVTGSGDPFASRNFRQLMTDLTPEAFPNLTFQIMTNGMLFTPRQWAAFPSLHGRVRILRISIDADEGPTHERLRCGARWPTMLENMAFAGELTRQGLVDHLELVFTVQHDNYREMGAAVDLAHRVGATGIYFARPTNRGTFSPERYRELAVFQPTHPDHRDFLDHMRDARLRDPIVLLGDLQDFVGGENAHRAFVRRNRNGRVVARPPARYGLHALGPLPVSAARPPVWASA